MIEFIVGIFWIHWFADFVMQSDKMAINKSSSCYWLSVHCFWYTLFISMYCVIYFGKAGLYYALLQGALHWVVDFHTSRLAKYFWEKEDRHNFFIVIGFDQAIHMTCLLGGAIIWGLL